LHRSGGDDPAVSVRQLRRCFSNQRAWRRGGGSVEALCDVNLDVAVGEVHGLLGPNGAGKTTLCRILATTLLPTSGSARVAGFDVVTSAKQVRRRIGIVFGGERGLYPRLTARQNLDFWAALYGVPSRTQRNRTERLLARVGLADRADERVEGFSRGMRQRLHLARGLVGEPTVLLLDEPTNGMDPIAGLGFRTLVSELRDDGMTVLLTTHNMAEAEACCDRVSLIDGGVLLASDRPALLSAALRGTRYIEADGVPGEVLAALLSLPGVRSATTAEPMAARLEVTETAVAPVLRRLVDAGVTSLRTSGPDLEQVYLTMVGNRGMEVAR
jgi:ABC-2 type transport system ATP-binding protein